MPGFEIVVRVARLAVESSAEGVEVLERAVSAAAAAYGVEVDLVVLPEQVLIGWLHVLRTSTFDLSPHTRSWSQAVREQIHNYRARLIGARACSSPAELEAKVFDLYRRLCSRESIPPPTRPTLLERCGPF